MKAKISIIECCYSDETTGEILFKFKDARKTLRKGHELRGIVTTRDGKKIRTSPIVSIKKNYIETRNSFYVFV